MSEVKHSLRLMVIDIEEDKVVVDEFCDSFVGGLSAKTENIKKPDNIELCVCKCGLIPGIGAVTAAEKAIMMQKKQIIKAFAEQAPSEVVEEVLGSDPEVEE